MRSLALSALTVPALALVAALSLHPAMAREAPSHWVAEWGATDFSKSAVSFDEIMSGGPPKDGIPSIDDPVFATAAEIDDLADTEPVISVLFGGEHRAYPLQILIWHEIVNDTVGGVCRSRSPSARSATRPWSTTGAWATRCWISAPPASSATPTS